MSKIAIIVENLSKIYRLGEIGTGTISHDLQRWWTMKVKGNEDPFLKIGEANDRANKGTSNIVYSLKDINFEIEQGDAVGIIGRNGAGKSTLLKLLSRVTSPTTGSIKIKGRVASLLEVGTGFHPELTGRENIYLNGAILGMRKKEISRKLDEIIDFSGVERYVDTPVKRYSSGMYVRLAFAVAAHLESEIMIVDEVLAVGDAEFQKKCLGKMGEVSKGEGRTILFVSHNMEAVKRLCTRGIVLSNGTKLFEGTQDEAVSEYFDSTRAFIKSSSLVDRKDREGSGKYRFSKLWITNSKGDVVDRVAAGDQINFHAVVSSKIGDEELSVFPTVSIYEKEGIKLLNLSASLYNKKVTIKGDTEIIWTIDRCPLAASSYYCDLYIAERPKGVDIVDYIKDVQIFHIEDGDYFISGIIQGRGLDMFYSDFEIAATKYLQ